MTVQQIYEKQLDVLRDLQKYKSRPEYSYIETKIKDICRELTDMQIKEVTDVNMAHFKAIQGTFSGG